MTLRMEGNEKKKKHLLTFALTVIVAWGLGTYAYVYFYPRLFYNRLERAIVRHGFGVMANGGRSSGVPVNTLYPMPTLASPSTSKSAGMNQDTLYTIGWLDLGKGPEILHVPDMADRYHSIQFIDPWGNVFAYVGSRTTGTRAGDYFITGPGWRGPIPVGAKQISSPNNKVLIIGRVLVKRDSDLATAYALEKQIRLVPWLRQ